MSYPNADISFPGLFGDWRFTLSPKLLDIGNGIYWYGVLIAAGLLIALWFCICLLYTSPSPRDCS